MDLTGVSFTVKRIGAEAIDPFSGFLLAIYFRDANRYVGKNIRIADALVEEIVSGDPHNILDYIWEKAKCDILRAFDNAKAASNENENS